MNARTKERVEALMKRGKAQGSDDPLCVLATAIYELQLQLSAMETRVRAAEHGPLRIGGAE